MPATQDVRLICIGGELWEDAMVEIIEILRPEHRNIEKLFRVMEVLRESVDRIVRDFIEDERRHMVLEDEVVFPAIVSSLHPEDWADHRVENS
jgi:hemerythrin-like domain-containing protein